MSKVIIFPVKNSVERERLRSLLVEKIGEYMGADINTKTIAVLEVTYPEDRPDVDILLAAIYNNITREKKLC